MASRAASRAPSSHGYGDDDDDWQDDEASSSGAATKKKPKRKAKTKAAKSKARGKAATNGKATKAAAVVVAANNVIPASQPTSSTSSYPSYPQQPMNATNNMAMVNPGMMSHGYPMTNAGMYQPWMQSAGPLVTAAAAQGGAGLLGSAITFTRYLCVVY